MNKDPHSRLVITIFDLNKLSEENRTDLVLTDEDHQALETLIEGIDIERSRNMVKMYFGVSTYIPQPYSVISRTYGIALETVRQIVLKELNRFAGNNILFPLATRLTNQGFESIPLDWLMSEGMNPKEAEMIFSQVRDAPKHTNRFLLECSPDCGQHSPCRTCRAKVVLQSAGLLTELEELARSFYGEVTSVNEIKLTFFDWSVRTHNCMRNEHIRTIGDLRKKSGRELMRVPNFGSKSLVEITESLEKVGIRLKDS